MQNSKIYATCQFFNYLSAGIYAGTLIADLSLAFTLNSIAMKVLFILMAIEFSLYAKLNSHESIIYTNGYCHARAAQV